MTSDNSPRIRREPLPTGAIVILRGDALDPHVLRADARRFSQRFAGWGLTGVSGYYARDENDVETLCREKLLNFQVVAVFARSDLDQAGVTTVGTFRTPHVTMAAQDVETLVKALINCPHVLRRNPYYEP